MALLGDSAGTPVVPISKKNKNGELTSLVIPLVSHLLIDIYFFQLLIVR